MANNKYSYFREQLELCLKQTGINILSNFNFPQWSSKYEFPFVYIFFGKDTIGEAIYEDNHDYSGTLPFLLYIGVSCKADEELLIQSDEITDLIETVIGRFDVPSKEFQNYTIEPTGCWLTNIASLLESGNNKGLYIITGNILYTLTIN